ncbi:MAG: hypothetical protein NTZ49_03595 [Candidatus Parcubacteria bacterium]|nr:hypothetical protein [Candidatus Parcubacteria bacterium]
MTATEMKEVKMLDFVKDILRVVFKKNSNVIIFCRGCGVWLTGTVNDPGQPAIILLRICPSCKHEGK